MMTILNDLRSANRTLGHFVVTFPAASRTLATPATRDAAINLFFREKAFWQFARGARLGDLRRLIRQYGRTESQVFPEGPFHKTHTTFGDDVNLPVTDTEKTNPNFKGCTDRNA
jgi:starch-binding outer membrane protein, SusD/RagB family